MGKRESINPSNGPVGQVRLWSLWLIVGISGACSLNYQVIWHRYLGMLLGSHAQATAVVLALFLLGLGLGYHYFGRLSSYHPELPKLYTQLELGISVWAALFPLLYWLASWLCGFAFGILGVTNIFTDLLVSALLLLPPTFLMGGTLPVLTEMFGRRLANPSRIHAKIYGLNTLGAAVGCLGAGFFLLPMLGLRWGIWVVAITNFLIAGGFWLAFRKFRDESKATTQEFHATPLFALNFQQQVLLFVSALSGFYIFTLETVLIRLSGLSAGASHHHFSLVVAIFILGLGLGSVFARKIADYRWRHLIGIQSLAVLGLVFVFWTARDWPYWNHLLRIAFRDDEHNYYLYQTILGFGLASILIIPISLCGVILPVVFHLFSKESERLGERVGIVYGINTLGAVAGALLGGYIFFYFFNLDQLFRMCIMLTVLGLAATVFAQVTARGMRWQLAGLAGTGVLFALSFVPSKFDHNLYIQPFRQTRPNKASYQGVEAFSAFLKGRTEYKLYEDGPNTSVGVGASVWKGKERSLSIFVNGKSDGNTNGDLFTTVMLAHIPGLLAESLEKVAVIGFGTGMTIGEIASYSQVKRVDVMEISPVLRKKAAPLFDPYNREVTQKPNVKIHQMDAFRFLAGADSKYDVIISEPSNPWVTGVENLFSQEFYQLARNKLKERGLFVQWIHTYSFSEPLFYMVLRTMRTVFPHVSIFQLKGRDYALVGMPEPWGQADVLRMYSRFDKNVAGMLSERGLYNVESVMAMELATPGISKMMSLNGPIHRLEKPRLSYQAQKDFFSNASLQVHEVVRGVRQYYAYVAEQSLLSILTGRQGLDAAPLKLVEQTFCDENHFKVKHLCDNARMMQVLNGGQPQDGAKLKSRDLANLSVLGQGLDEKKRIANQTYDLLEFYKKHYSPVAMFSGDKMLTILKECTESSPQNSTDYGECLLQQILFNVSVRLESEGLNAMIDGYDDWFAKVDPSIENYAKFLNAREILDGMRTKKAAAESKTAK